MVCRTNILIKHTAQFYKTPPWWIRTSRYTRTLYNPNSLGRTEAWIMRRHMETFGDWLQKRCQGDESLDEQLYLLSTKPSWHILTYKGYEIIGNTFYTIAQDKISTNQNSGVRIDAMDPNGNKKTYYGRIEEIWELNYC